MLTERVLVFVLALAAGPALSSTAIGVHSNAIGRDGRFAARNSAYGADIPPEVDWTAVAGAKSYAIVLDDPDAPGGEPFVHWLVWNIPSSRTRLAEGAPPAGVAEGQNSHGGSGYWGPHPPSGTHHYHLRVIALDTELPLAPGANRAQFTQASRGHSIASGEIVGLFSPPPH
ncbi:MAG TPA: YbhB/YbcL family Raf kinase inhibitor-like protein [Caulobacteraceae bacterium]|jgi:Raf kinase inhibitor-like YbhB/YbcL family protein